MWGGGKVISYGFSIQGKNHLKNGTVCQDFHKTEKITDKWYIAVVADGVGSACKAEIGAKIAVETVVEFCKQNIEANNNVTRCKRMMDKAFREALIAIRKEAKATQDDIMQYDTTLTCGLYDGDQLIYGQSGDGGIIVINTDGNIECVTKPQKGIDGISVCPLRDEAWIIENHRSGIAGVLFLTDGLYDTVMPYLLRFSENKIYIPMVINYFSVLGQKNDISNYVERLLCNRVKEEEYNNRIEHWLRNLGFCSDDCEEIIHSIQQNEFPLSMLKEVLDDKTAVALINEKGLIKKKDKEYYMEPKWNEYIEKWNRQVYPHLYIGSEERKR